jgi:hypothetical protein
MKRYPALLHLLGSGQRAHPQLFHTQQTVVIRIERDQRVIFRRQPKCFHRQMFQRQQQLSPVFQQKLYIRAGKVDCDFRIFHLRVRVRRNAQFIGERKARVGQQRI